MSRRPTPVSLDVHAAPPSTLLSTPELVAAYTVREFRGSTATARTSVPASPELFQVSPAPRVLKTPKLVPAYRTAAFDGSMTRARTVETVRPTLLACQVTPRSTLLKTPEPSVPAYTLSASIAIATTCALAGPVPFQLSPAVVLLKTPAPSVPA